MRILISFVLIRSVSALFGDAFVNASAGLSLPLIQRISEISRLSYDYLNAITSIIRRFSFVVPSFTRHSYREKESVQITKGTGGSRSWSIINFKVVTIDRPISKPATMLYISEASTLLVTLLHFTELQWTMFPRS